MVCAFHACSASTAPVVASCPAQDPRPLSSMSGSTAAGTHTELFQDALPPYCCFMPSSITREGQTIRMREDLQPCACMHVDVELG